jgi:hypothetical protein
MSAWRICTLSQTGGMKCVPGSFHRSRDAGSRLGTSG